MSRSCDATIVIVVFNSVSKQDTLEGSESLDAPVSIQDSGGATQCTYMLETLWLKWNQKIQKEHVPHIKVKLPLYQAVEAHRVVRRRCFHTL
jgi:hypothetical protein